MESRAEEPPKRIRRLKVSFYARRSNAQWSGDGTINELIQGPAAKLVLIHCYRSMNYICRSLEESYGLPWMKITFENADIVTILMINYN